MYGDIIIMFIYMLNQISLVNYIYLRSISSYFDYNIKFVLIRKRVSFLFSLQLLDSLHPIFYYYINYIFGSLYSNHAVLLRLID